MRKLFIKILIIFVAFGKAYAQDSTIQVLSFKSMNDFVGIKITGGLTALGTESVSLQREGLIYWSNPFFSNIFSKEKREEVTKLVPWTELDQKKVFKIMQYVYDNKLYDYQPVSPPEGAILTEGNPTTISFLIIRNGSYSEIYYKYCDEKLDKLIRMINNLIPQKDREHFRMCTYCP